MLKPTYEIQIGSETFEPNTSGDVISIRVDLDIDKPADSFEIVFMMNDRSSSLGKGDDASISLGYEDNLVKVFKGTIDIVEPRLQDCGYWIKFRLETFGFEGESGL
jgi:phage protein D